MNLLSLPAISVLSDNISIVEIDTVKVIRILHEKATAAISLFGAHLISYQPHGHQECLFLSKDAQFNGETPIRGGIPVCWPWFNKLAEPSHGFARTSEWQLKEHRENEAGVIIQLSLQHNEQTRNIWPYEFETLITFEIKETAHISLTVKNTDERPWTFSGALHTYLNVGNILTTQTKGLGTHYLDSLQGGKECIGEDTLILTDTIDRVYTKPESLITIHDDTWNRALVVKNEGHNSAVAWNPWKNGAENMTDMNNDGYQNMLCVESVIYSNCLSAGQTLQPGETHVLSTQISAK
ncbi:D-hexose-6-phosphate mutarotase [Vibrio salinus]|uniref:D-hexose-6-phosphate mutarotase n=1 Tax=Vibrio salinus TaxID=2899784 RepID=UPI001E28CC0D|nr:D-hexose-6-phosphate mutarotase [Vibrio salinus]MCE0492922.1 D-hexose-6-phosphate mutarotase [Vibrio salinus]